MDRRDWLKTAGIFGAGLIANQANAMNIFHPNELRRQDFGPDFQWGVATAAYQIEGAWNIDGKGPSIWDTFSHTKGKIKTGENGDIACNFYENYPNDIALMKQMGIPNSRFSISWSRILPDGKGVINQKGLDFYDRVIDKSLELGIVPWVTIFHWDLPQALQSQGGWADRKILGAFNEYADLITRKYGDRVKNWMVLNEPMAFTSLGYLLGIHAPGKRSIRKFVAACHYVSMCQAEGGRIIRANVSEANVGTTISASQITPKNDKPKHLAAAKRADALINRIFLDPMVGKGYPTDDLPLIRSIHKYMEPGDEEKLAFDFDFLGLQYYTRQIVKSSLIPFIRANIIKPEKAGIPREELTDMGWEVYPEGIYSLLKRLDQIPQIKKIIVTENGCAFPDQVEGNSIHDPRRIQFLKDYLSQVLKAKQEGVKVDGYFVWSFMDNFEWAEGYFPRFGLVHVDYETQQRRIKDSGKWYSDFLSGK